MSYSIDANILLYASNSGDPAHEQAKAFLNARASDPDLMCLTWPALMAYLRIATHPSIFKNPLATQTAWKNIQSLTALPRCTIIQENDDFPAIYAKLINQAGIRGNLVPDSHIAGILQVNGVKRIYTADSDFRKFEFLEVVNPLT